MLLKGGGSVRLQAEPGRGCNGEKREREYKVIGNFYH